MPQYQVEILQKGPGRARGRLVQTGGLYRNPVEIELKGASDKRFSVRVTPVSAEHDFEVDVTVPVESYVVDPQARVLFAREKP